MFEDQSYQSYQRYPNDVDVKYTMDWFEKNGSKIQTWWDPDDDLSQIKKDYFPKYCSNHFDLWFDKVGISYNDINIYAKHCSRHFDKWWPKVEYANIIDCHSLFSKCTKHFLKWYNPYKMNRNANEYYLLPVHCKEFFNIWFVPAMLGVPDMKNLIKEKCQDEYIDYVNKFISDDQKLMYINKIN